MTTTTWNFTPLFHSDDDPDITKDQERIKAANQTFVKAWKDRTDYLDDVIVLREALDAYEQLEREYSQTGKSWYYFSLRQEQEQDNPTLKAKGNQVTDLVRELATDIQFFTLRLSRIPREQQEIFLAAPKLAPYRHFLHMLFANADHLLSEAEERILTLKGGVAHGHWVKMTSMFLSQEEREVLGEDGKRATVSFPQLLSLMSSQQKPVRDEAAAAFADILRKHAPVATEELNAILDNKRIDDKLRSFDRPDQSRHLGDGIETEVVDVVLATVEEAFSLAQEYYQLKAQLFGVPRLAYHERNVPYGSVDKPYPFSEACSLVTKVFEQLSPEFSEIFQQFMDNGQLDVFPRKGKASGAFCAHALITQPTYILLNHTDKLQDVLTLAHELGHGIHNELMRRKQHALSFSTSLATAEVASTFMEDFVLTELQKEADDDLRLALLMMKLNDDVSSIMRQVACYRFEQALHAEFRTQGYLATEEIGTLFQKHMAAYMGDAVEQGEGSELYWVYWSHIRNFFYVYSYASGLLISKALQALVKEDVGNIDKVKFFMEAGESASPRELFAEIGIDMTQKTFWEKGIGEIKAGLAEAKNLAGVI